MRQEDIARKLFEFSERSSIRHRSMQDIRARLEALRGCGLLPRGDQKYSEDLSVDEVVSCVLSLAVGDPAFAGHAAVVARKLRPVGGSGGPIFGARSFGEALSLALQDKKALSVLVNASLTTSEIFNNGYGRGRLTLRVDDKEVSCYYVGETACSLFTEGAQATFDEFEHMGGLVEEFHFHSSLFHELSLMLSAPAPVAVRQPVGFFAEEDAEEEKKKIRLQALKITSESQFLNREVNVRADWPDSELLIEFGGYRFVLMPPTKLTSPSIHIDLSQPGLDEVMALGLANEFLSLLTWSSDQPAFLKEGWSGSPLPNAVPRDGISPSLMPIWIFQKSRIDDPKKRKALALYRDGRIALENFLVLYAVLSFYKVLETVMKKHQIKTWITENYPKLSECNISSFHREKINALIGDQNAGDYFLNEGRHVVAHAKNENTSNPDDYNEIRRLYLIAEAFRVLSRECILATLKISEEPY